MNFLKIGLSVVLSSIFALLCTAQVADQPIEVPVKFKSKVNVGYTFHPGGVTYYNASVTASIAVNDTTTIIATASGSTPTLETAVQTAMLEPGKPYSLVVSTTGCRDNRTVIITAPPGYLFTVDGVSQNSLKFGSASKTYSIRIVPSETLTSQPAGTASSLTGGQIKWNVALGSLLNGDSAGAISIVGAATGASASAWDLFYKPDSLYYESPSSEVYVDRLNGVIRQISANEAFVTVVQIDGASYDLNFYSPGAAQGTSYPKAVTGLPFISYRISKDTASAYKLRITKTTRSLTGTADTTITAPVTRTEWTTVERTGTFPAFVWTVADWTLSNAAPITREVRTWSGINPSGSAGHNETIQILDSADAVVAQVVKVHSRLAWGDTPTSVTAGTSSSVTTNTEYNTDSTNAASYGFAKSVQSTGGSWSAYDYFPTTDEKKLGTISALYAPYLSLPATVTMQAGSGVVTTMDYSADAFDMLRRLNSSETRVNGILTSKTQITYGTYTSNGLVVVQADRRDFVNSSNATLSSTTRTYQEDTADAFFRNQLRGSIAPDGTAQSTIHQRGNWDYNTATFTPNTSGKASRIGTVTGMTANTPGTQLLTDYAGFNLSDIYVIPNESTLSFVIRDSLARIYRTETLVWNGTAWNLINWTDFGYNWNNQVTYRASSNGDTYEASYLGELKQWERDGSGIKVSYTYDEAGRVKTVTKEGINGLPDLITENTYNAADQLTKQEVYPASGSTERLSTTRTYDLASRVTSEVAPGLDLTSYSYDPVNRSQTVTTPDGATRTQTSYLDGQPFSVTGSGTVAQYMTYGVESDGRRWTKTNLASETSPRWSKSWTDWLGRSVESRRPGFTGQPDYSETATYHPTTGQLIKTSRAGMADTLITYDVYGQPLLSGVDINANGILDLASNDRITGQENWFANENGAWWAASRSYTYATSNSSTETTTGSSRQRLSGWSGNLRSESTVTDTEGNVSTSTVMVNRTARTVTKTTTAPGLANPQVEIAVNGLGTSVTAPDGIVTTAAYDALQRPTTSSNVRAGVTRSTVTTYKPNTTWPETISDQPANKTTATIAYDTMGRKKSVKDANNKFTYFSYTDRGEPAAQWGEATAPLSFGYSTYGERTALTTYRTDGAWSTATWPSPAPAGDTTTWEFDGPSGLLKKKTDAATPAPRYVEYAYNSRGQVLNRYWARTVDGTPGGTRVTATYGYDPNTGEPTSITYNDNGVTPSVTTTYTRLGQASTVTDYTGTRSFTFDPAAPWRLATTTLPAFYQGNVFTSLYETTTDSGAGTVKGRARGFQLGTVAAPAALLQQTYAVNNLGRLTGITAARTNGAATQAFAYTYLTGSRLLQSVAATGTAFTTTRTYETSRDLLTNIKGQWSTTTATEFAYTHDDFARRDTAAQSGTAFDDYGTGTTTRQRYTYNDRGEITAATGYLGAEDAANKLPGRQFEFGYDAAGNRVKANHTGDPAKADIFTPNELNQLVTRQNKNVSVSGTASTSAVVAVDDKAVVRKGRYWQTELTIAELVDAAVRSYTTVAALPGAGSGGADVAQLDRRFIFLPPGTETLTYDADGNLKTDGRWTYTWDAENRLISMQAHFWTVIPNVQPRQRLDFSYDSNGRRVRKAVLNEGSTAGSWNLVNETRYLYDGWNLLAEFDVQSTVLNFKASYVWGLDLVGSLSASGGVGALLQITDYSTGTNYFPTYDGNGNVAALINAGTGGVGTGGAIAASYEYNAFGELLRASGTYAKANPFRFSTKFTDNESGLIYYGHRYYDAKNGRFINRDPIEERGGMNLYGFCGNDGVNRYDYLGLDGLLERFGDWVGRSGKRAAKWLGQNQWVGIVAAVALAAWGGWAISNLVGNSMLAAAQGSTITVGFSSTAGTFGFGTAFAAPTLSGGFALTGLGTAVAGAAGGAAGGLIGGVVSAGLTGGNILRSGLTGALVGGISGGFLHGMPYGARVAGHAALGGGASVAQGGKFGPGALASGLTVGLGIGHLSSNALANIIASSAIGGGISQITGGSFMQGAMTTGIQVAFNDYRDTVRSEGKSAISRIRSTISRTPLGEIIDVSMDDWLAYLRHQTEKYEFYSRQPEFRGVLGWYAMSGLDGEVFRSQTPSLSNGGRLFRIGNNYSWTSYGGDLNYADQGIISAIAGFENTITMQLKIIAWNYATLDPGQNMRAMPYAFWGYDVARETLGKLKQ